MKNQWAVDRARKIVEFKHLEAKQYQREGFPQLAKMTYQECELYQALLEIIDQRWWVGLLFWRKS